MRCDGSKPKQVRPAVGPPTITEPNRLAQGSTTTGRMQSLKRHCPARHFLCRDFPPAANGNSPTRETPYNPRRYQSLDEMDRHELDEIDHFLSPTMRWRGGSFGRSSAAGRNKQVSC